EERVPRGTVTVAAPRDSGMGSSSSDGEPTAEPERAALGTSEVPNPVPVSRSLPRGAWRRSVAGDLGEQPTGTVPALSTRPSTAPVDEGHLECGRRVDSDGAGAMGVRARRASSQVGAALTRRAPPQRVHTLWMIVDSGSRSPECEA